MLDIETIKLMTELNKGAGSLAKDISDIQEKIRGIKKDKLGNAGGTKVGYVGGDKVLETIMPELASRNILLHTSVVPGSVKNIHRIAETRNGQKIIFDYSAIMHFQFIKGDEIIQGFYSVEGNQFDDTAKAKGTGETYSERYFLLKYFKIETDKDDSDAKDNGTKPAGTAQVAKVPAVKVEAKKPTPKAEAKVETKDIKASDAVKVFVNQLKKNLDAKGQQEMLDTIKGQIHSFGKAKLDDINTEEAEHIIKVLKGEEL